MQDWEQERYLLHSRLNSFNKKVDSAILVIRAAFTKTWPWSISCSYGKDSLVLLDLIMSVEPSCMVIFKDSGYGLPETYDTMKACEERYGYKTLIKCEEMSWEELLDTYGLPGINRTDAQQKRVVDIIKKSVLTDFSQQHGAKGIFWGLRMQESRGRRIMLRKHSPTFQNKSNGMWFCAPLFNWNGDDVWAYIVSRELPYPKFYDYEDLCKTRDWIRNTGWASTDGAAEGRVVWLRRYYPELYKKLADKYPEVRNYV